jgi:hypothetical protein
MKYSLVQAFGFSALLCSHSRTFGLPWLWPINNIWSGRLTALFLQIHFRRITLSPRLEFPTFAMTSFLLLFSLFLSAAQTAAPLPKFEDYRVTQRFEGKNAKTVLRTRADRQFRTRLREASQEKVNFAGHYVLSVWGCGGGCLMGLVIDARSGRVDWIPFNLCCWPLDVEEPLDFRLDSRLIVFTGSRNEKGQGIYYYKFERNRFVLLHAVEKSAD